MIHTYQTSWKLFKSEINIVSIWQKKKSDIGYCVDGKCADCDGDCDDDDDNAAYDDDDDDAYVEDDDDDDDAMMQLENIPPVSLP